MSTSLCFTESNSIGKPGVGIYRKENEKKRSKCNRDKFKLYMEELNEAMGFKKLSINKCLSTAVSVMKLSKFSDKFPEQSEGSLAPSLFYEVGNYLGLAFDENGRVLHISHKLADLPLPFNMCHVGSFLHQICFNTDQILGQVFGKQCPFMEMKLKYSKKNKQPTTMFFRGKVLFNPALQIRIFIGYGFIQDKRDAIRDPFMFNSGLEVWIDSKYDVIKSHSWLELLLEDSLKYQAQQGERINLFSLLHPEDLGVINICEEQMKTQGFFKISCRLYDGENYLWVTARGFPQKRGTERYAEVYVWPFAYEDFKTGDMFLLDVKKLWSKKQKRVKIHKTIRSDTTSLNSSLMPAINHEPPAQEIITTEFSDMPRKRPRSDGESSEASESCGESPKRMALDRRSSLSSPEPYRPLKPFPKRVSAFEARKGKFVPVTGSLPLLKQNVEKFVEKKVRIEPVVMHTDYVNHPASPEISSSGSRTPDSEPQEPHSPTFPPTMTLKKNTPDDLSASQFNISRLMQMNAVFKELKETNAGLFYKFADVLDPNKKPEADGLLSFLPLILQLQERDLITGYVLYLILFFDILLLF